MRRKINDIVARRGAVRPPSQATTNELAELADQAENEANQSQNAERALELAGNAIGAVKKLDLE